MMKKLLCFTVDLDRDVNVCVEGKVAAGSMDRGSGTSPRFGSSSEGLTILADLLDELGMKATFFAEGRTLENISNGNRLSGHEVGIHGLDHEDLTGCSGAMISAAMLRAIVERSMALVKDNTGRTPVCARAPYMKADDFILETFSESGIKYDSSEYAEMCQRMVPYEREGLIEVPVAESTDAQGNKISAYLWQMHEGRRRPEDYIRMVSGMEGGIFCLATHTWHMAETRGSGRMDAAARAANAADVRKVLEGILDSGFKSATIPEAVKACPPALS